MRDPPLSVILTWPKPNYVDPPHRTYLNGIFIAVISLAVIIVLMRIFVRIALLKSAGFDDLCIVLAIVS
jgi:hypothetical protein